MWWWHRIFIYTDDLVCMRKDWPKQMEKTRRVNSFKMIKRKMGHGHTSMFRDVICEQWHKSSGRLTKELFCAWQPTYDHFSQEPELNKQDCIICKNKVKRAKTVLQHKQGCVETNARMKTNQLQSICITRESHQTTTILCIVQELNVDLQVVANIISPLGSQKPERRRGKRSYFELNQVNAVAEAIWKLCKCIIRTIEPANPKSENTRLLS